MRFRAICLIICSLCLIAEKVPALEICGELKQGELLLVKDVDNQGVSLFRGVGIKEISESPSPIAAFRDYTGSSDGYALIALHRDTPSKVTLGVYPWTDAGTLYELKIVPQTWDIQRISGVLSSKVTPTSKADLAEIKREQHDIGRAVREIPRHGGLAHLAGRCAR